jgi:hypothetical protein
MRRKGLKRERTPRIAPPAPTFAEVEQKYIDVIEGRITFEEADDWAMQWVAADENGINDEAIWSGVYNLAGCSERHGPQQPHLFTRASFEEWLTDFRSRRPQ